MREKETEVRERDIGAPVVDWKTCMRMRCPTTAGTGVQKVNTPVPRDVVGIREIQIAGLEEEDSCSVSASRTQRPLSPPLSPAENQQQHQQFERKRLLEMIRELQVKSTEQREQVAELLSELDEVVADNELLVKDNQQLLDQNVVLREASHSPHTASHQQTLSADSIYDDEPRHSLSDTAPVSISDKTEAAELDEQHQQVQRGSQSTGSTTMQYQQLLTDNMKLASDNRQLLEDNNQLFADNKKIISDLSKLQEHGELLFRDNCKLSEDLNLALKTQLDSTALVPVLNASLDDADETSLAALNTKLLQVFLEYVCMQGFPCVLLMQVFFL